jgi:hypothetical protein
MAKLMIGMAAALSRSGTGRLGDDAHDR